MLLNIDAPLCNALVTSMLTRVQPTNTHVPVPLPRELQREKIMSTKYYTYSYKQTDHNERRRIQQPSAMPLGRMCEMQDRCFPELQSSATTAVKRLCKEQTTAMFYSGTTRASILIECGPK